MVLLTVTVVLDLGDVVGSILSRSYDICTVLFLDAGVCVSVTNLGGFSTSFVNIRFCPLKNIEIFL
jgi:hypothetical protein